jgi:serine/threonine protein kinase
MSIGVAHGDIKPENFLIEESERGEFNCRMIDFGSCAIRGQKRLPTKSPPWNAPELDDAQEFTSDNLILSDIYSFGLLCVHIILPLDELANANAFLIRRPRQTDDQWQHFLSAMVGKKSKDSGDTLALEILNVIEKSDIPTNQKLLLRKIVNETIKSRSDYRTFPWSEMRPHIEEFLSERYLDGISSLVSRANVLLQLQ